MTNFTIIDVCKVLAALFLFAPLILFPGYVIGWLSDGLQFRSRNIREKLMIAVPLSISTVPFLIYFVGRFGSMSLVWIATAIASGMFIVLITRDLRGTSHLLAGTRWPLAIIGLWIVVGLASLVDFHWSDRLYIAASSFDYAVRNQITEAITRTGVRPQSPFFFPGHPVLLRYHYFWFLPCSLVTMLSGGWVGPAHALMAGTLWCGVALMALVVMYVWYFRKIEAGHSRRRAWTGVALLWVIGLDILPALLMMLAGAWLFTIDKWNEEIDGWLVSLLWAPHYVAGVITCLTGFLILWKGAGRAWVKQIGGIVVAAIAFASLTGTAIYIALVFAASLAVFGLIALFKRWWEDVFAIAIAGTLAAALAAPYLLGLVVAGGAQAGPGQALVVPTVRAFTLVDSVLKAFQIGHPLIAVANFFLLPVNYLLELGLLFIVGVVQARRYHRRRATLGRKEWAEIVLIGVPIVICTFFRSSVVENNDLGWRGFLIPQFVLLLWSIDYVRFGLRKRSRSNGAMRSSVGLGRLRNQIVVTLFLGAIGTVFEFGLNRVYIPAFDFGWNQHRSWLYPEQVAGKRVLGLREAYEWLDRHIPQQAIMLHNSEFPDLSFGLYSKHQTVSDDGNCGANFGGSMDACRELRKVVLPLFAKQKQGTDPDVEFVCRQYSVSIIVVRDIDPVWQSPQAWVWKRTPIFSNDFSRVFACKP